MQRREKIQSKKNKLIKRKQDEKKKDKKEEDLEKKKGGLSGTSQKQQNKILKPVKGLFERIFDYLKLTALNFVVGSVYKWFTDPANKESKKNKKFLYKYW